MEQQIADKQEELNAAEQQRAEIQAQIDVLTAQKNQLETTKTALQQAETLLAIKQEANAAAKEEADRQAAEINKRLEELRRQMEEQNRQLDEAHALLDKLNTQRAEMQATLQKMEENPTDPALGDMASGLLLSGMEAQLQLAELQVTSGKTQLESGQQQLDDARKEYEDAREEALKNANLDTLLNMQTLAQLIYAQNFSMPAGYIQDGDDKYLLKVGETFDSVEELEGALLCSIDGVGDVRLRDVADIRVADNAEDAYAKVNNNQAVVLAIFKGSTASTSAVADACNAKAAELMAEDANLRLTTIMDQGMYIKLIVNSVVSNLVWGAVLAIIVLALFLKDVRPTAVVAISMPLSVLFAIVLMYFSNITLNIISLSGLALGIGMLVDNSVVVIENIYRLRSRGVPAARAAVQGGGRCPAPSCPAPSPPSACSCPSSSPRVWSASCWWTWPSPSRTVWAHRCSSRSPWCPPPAAPSCAKRGTSGTPGSTKCWPPTTKCFVWRYGANRCRWRWPWCCWWAASPP